MDSPYVNLAKEVFSIESASIAALGDNLNGDFDIAINSILEAKGKVIVCGMGKSGIIGHKIAATLASTGTPSFFMHPGEAYHGDLGMVTSNDVFVAISNSGETEEVVKLIPFLKENGNTLVAMTGNPRSTLANAAKAHLNVSVRQEACPLQLAPTSSTTAALAMGDAIAVTLMKARDFQPENFARFHPGGSLGRRLLAKVDDEMISDDLPFIPGGASMLDVIGVMSKGRLGLAIVEEENTFSLITDGDVRRVLEKFKEQVFSKRANEFMTRNPTFVPKGTRVEDALILMNGKGITSLLVTENGSVIGVFKK